MKDLQFSSLLLSSLSVFLSSLLSPKDAFPQQPTLNMAAASDLAPVQEAMQSLIRQKLGVEVRIVSGSTGLLANQIRHGAPYDLYMAASRDYVDDLAKSGHILADSVVVYAHGRLALWSKSNNISQLSDLLGPAVKRVAIANPAHAPYGRAARSLLENLGLWERLRPKVVLGENVRQALQFAESGNADAAIVALPLVKGSRPVVLSASAHAPIVQAGGVVAASKSKADARRVLLLLASPDGRGLFTSAGFDPPR